MSQPAADPALLAATVDVLEELFGLTRRVALSEEEEALGEGLRTLREAVARAAPPFALQVLGDAVLRDRQALPLTLEQLRHCQQLAGACARFGANEITIEEVPSVEALLALAKVVFTATNAAVSARAPQIVGLRFRTLRRVGDATPPQEAVLHDCLRQQLDRACEQTEGLPGDPGTRWPLRDAHAVCRRVERCIAAGVTATARALELAPPPWSAARRSVSAVFYGGAVLSRMQASPLSQRGAAHALLALGRFGLSTGMGRDCGEAAAVALPSLVAANTQSAFDPVVLRACALLRALAGDAARSSAPLVPLLHAVYELERRRGPEGDLQLTRLDLHAWLASALGQTVHSGWGRALLGVLGILPVGAHVLADGQLGVVMAATADASKPRVLVAGQLVVPSKPVQPYSPLAMTPWAK
ncbi:MAG: hypothetical protein ACHQ53_04810 [Polyangiales bacterium]